MAGALHNQLDEDNIIIKHDDDIDDDDYDDDVEDDYDGDDDDKYGDDDEDYDVAAAADDDDLNIIYFFITKHQDPTPLKELEQQRSDDRVKWPQEQDDAELRNVTEMTDISV